MRDRGRALTTNSLAQADVYRMIRRRAFNAGIKASISNHTFRATGITQYLRNGGRREPLQSYDRGRSPSERNRVSNVSRRPGSIFAAHAWPICALSLVIAGNDVVSLRPMGVL